MRPVVVQDQVEGLPRRRVSVDGAQELQKVLVAMTRIAGANHGAVEHIECREQAGGAVALVIMRQGARIAPSSWASPVAFDPTPGPAISHPRTAPAPCPGG